MAHEVVSEDNQVLHVEDLSDLEPDSFGTRDLDSPEHLQLIRIHRPLVRDNSSPLSRAASPRARDMQEPRFGDR